MKSIMSGTMVVLLAVAGCGDKANNTQDATGIVKFDGVPLPKGRITFYSADGSVPASAEIIDGAYKIAAKPGQYKVQVQATKIDPSIKPSNDPVRPVSNEVNYIPAKYNTATELTADVGSKKEFNFDLTSK